MLTIGWRTKVEVEQKALLKAVLEAREEKEIRSD